MCRSRSYNSQKRRFARPPVAVLEEHVLQNHARKLFVCFSAIAALFLSAHAPRARAQSSATLAERIQKVIDRPEFAHANFGIKFVALDTGKVLYSLNSNKLFVPASTTKLLTEGTVLAKLGADYRFHTRIYRTAPIDKKGKLKGDLILVASGDPNLSNRIRPDGTLAFVDEDHSYNGPAVAGDPLAATNHPPAAKSGYAAAFVSPPQSSYIKFVSHVTTGAATSKLDLDLSDPITNPD